MMILLMMTVNILFWMQIKCVSSRLLQIEGFIIFKTNKKKEHGKLYKLPLCNFVALVSLNAIVLDFLFTV